jgi:hypothetical protein
MSKPHYVIRRERDRRLIAGAFVDIRSLEMAERIRLEWQAIAGAFVDIRSLEMAERIRLEWQANYPNDSFLVETV